MQPRESTGRRWPRLILLLAIAGGAVLAMAGGVFLASGDPGPADPAEVSTRHGHGGVRFGAGPGPGWGPPFDDGHHHRHLRGPCGGKGAMALLDRLPEDLALSEQQREEIRSIMEEARVVMEPLGETLDQKRDAVRDAMHAEPLDEAALRASLRALSDAETDLTVLRARTRVKVSAHLTQEQRDFLQEQMRSRDRDLAGDRDRDRSRDRDRDVRQQRRLQRLP